MYVNAVAGNLNTELLKEVNKTIYEYIPTKLICTHGTLHHMLLSHICNDNNIW